MPVFRKGTRCIRPVSFPTAVHHYPALTFGRAAYNTPLAAASLSGGDEKSVALRCCNVLVEGSSHPVAFKRRDGCRVPCKMKSAHADSIRRLRCRSVGGFTFRFQLSRCQALFVFFIYTMFRRLSRACSAQPRMELPNVGA